MLDSQGYSTVYDAINKAVDDSLRSLLWFQLLLLVISAILTSLFAFLTFYMKKKAENFATKEDFREILRQLKETTRATEEIKAEISTGTWVNEQRWKLRKSIYLTLLEKLSESKQALGDVIEAEEGSFDGSETKRKSHIAERLQRISSASVDIRNAIDRSGGILFLSGSALDSLREYEAAEEKRLIELTAKDDPYGNVSADATSWSSYLNHQWDAADRAFKELVEAAKKDLQLRS
ncbi:MAG: hypothetical protein QOF62_2609 [Pyrinomonadaceae bacterium]|nr:hypothetical protein [Pyrinomonadaceae bacterium]